MSILIKGMEMPKDCLDCPYTAYVVREGSTYCRITGAVLARDFEVTNDGYKPEDCPIVPVPPHGRIIDADALKKNAYPFPCAIGTEWAVTLRQINDAPAIIPADGGAE